MSWRVSLPLRAGLLLGLARLIAGLLLMGYARLNSEAHALVLLDLPTMGIYSLLAICGFNIRIADAADLRFLAAGTVVWIVIGAMSVVLAAALIKIKTSRSINL